MDEAISEWRKAIKLDPNDAGAHNSLGTALAAKGKVDEAISEFRKAIELDPKNALAHGNLGLGLLQQGRFAQAEASTRRARGLLPPDHPVRPRMSQQLESACRMHAGS